MSSLPGLCAPEDDSPDLFSYARLYHAYLACRRTKRNTAAALAFEARQELNLLELQAELRERRYRPAPSACFVTTRPKLREILAADFRGRVVHHLLVGRIEPDWERVFIHDSYACRRGKGVHAAVDRLQTFLLRATANGTCEAWYLQLDIANYFMSIDKALLWERLARRIHDPDIAWLARLLVFPDCTEGALYKGRAELLDRIPAHKSLFHCPPGKGLPIGNLNSQFFANVYLDALDQFVKHQLKCNAYLRYCDDFVLVARDRETLRGWRDAIAAFLEERLRLALNPKRERLRPVADGVDFLGYIVRPHYRLARRRVVYRMHDRLAGFERDMVHVRRGPRPVARIGLERAQGDALQATLASYLGHLRWANTRKLTASLPDRFPFLTAHFRVDAAARQIERRIPARCPARQVKDQYAWWRRKFPGDVLFFQVGRYCEFYQARDASTARLLGLTAMKPNRRGARWGFAVRRLAEYLGIAVRAGRSVVLVLQQRTPATGFIARAAVARYEVAENENNFVRAGGQPALSTFRV